MTEARGEKHFLVPGKWNVWAHLEAHTTVLRVGEEEQCSKCGMFQTLQIPFKTQTRRDVRKCEAGSPPPPPPPPLQPWQRHPAVCLPVSPCLQGTSCCRVNLYSQNTGVIACLRYEASVPHYKCKKQKKNITLWGNSRQGGVGGQHTDTHSARENVALLKHNATDNYFCLLVCCLNEFKTRQTFFFH